MIYFIKNIFFLCHLLGILISLFGLFFYWQTLILQGIVIITWYFNNNRCILTQLEDYLFGESIIDIYFNLTNNHKNYKKYIVPRYQRYTVYFLFGFGLLFKLIKFF